MKQFDNFIGNSQTLTSTLHAEQANLMLATLDRVPNMQTGDALPPLWHWIYFHSAAPMSGLGRDGHATKGEFLPPIPLPRRMWAGGRLHFEKPALIGESITRVSTIKNVVNKDGRSGPLCFVTVLHEQFSSDGALCFWEEQDIVYRQDPTASDSQQAPKPAPQTSHASEIITPNPVQLFRYSALTFNSHRIHYDVDYCRDVEGYPGLIFHGPLSATLLADFAMRKANGRTLKGFDFRAVSPLFDTEQFYLETDGESSFWAKTKQGNLAMMAQVIWT